jgi:hypothetical protein
MSEAVSVVELPTFAREARRVWNEDEIADFITFIAFNPTSGDLIPGTGGFRKIRWGGSGAGKSGGVRVIYFYHDPRHPLYLTGFYAKSAKRNLSSGEISALRSLATQAKRLIKEGKDPL